MQAITRVPALVDMFLLLLRSSDQLPSDLVRIIDGPTINNDTIQTLIIVGWDPVEDRNIIDSQRETDELYPHVTEIIDIPFIVDVVNGDANVKAARDRAAAVLNIIADITTSPDRSLQGVVERIALGPSITWTQTAVRGGVGTAVRAHLTGMALL